MRTSTTITACLALLTIGYVLGASQILSPGKLLAQGQSKAKAKAGGAPQGPPPLTDETKAKIKAAADALNVAKDALIAENRYDSAIKGVNAFAVLTGGNNSIRDLATNGGVDPETFAALHAGIASDSIVVDLGHDPSGKLTYKGRVVRMYPKSVIINAYARRAEITGEDLLPAVTDDSSKAKAKKKAAETDEEKTEEEQ